MCIPPPNASGMIHNQSDNKEFARPPDPVQESYDMFIGN